MSLGKKGELMSKTTERLVQVAALTMILWFGWDMAKQTIIAQIRANNQAAMAAQQLRACEAKK